MIDDGENTQQGQCSQRGNGQLAEHEPHVIHLLSAERELLAECHRCGLYLALCGEVLPVSELQSSLCEPGCERMVTYCQKCLDDAVRVNAEAGLLPIAHGGAQSQISVGDER